MSAFWIVIFMGMLMDSKGSFVAFYLMDSKGNFVAFYING